MTEQGEKVTFITGFGWVCQTEESGGPFVVGPFTDEVEGRVWLSNIGRHLSEDMSVFGPTALFYPESFTEVHAAVRRVAPEKAGTLTLGPGVTSEGPLRPEDMDG